MSRLNFQVNLEKAYGFIPASIISLDENAIINYANTAALQLINRKYEEIIGKHIGDAISCSGSLKNIDGCGCGPLCSGCKLRLLITNVLKNEQVIRDTEIEGKLIIKGKEVDSWLKISAALVIVENSNCVLLSIVNITDNKRENLELAYTRDYCFNLLSKIPSLICVLNLNMECIYVNEEWERFTGQKAENALGLGVVRVIHPDDIKACERIVKEVSLRKKSTQLELRVKNYEGEFRWCMVKVTLHYNIDGNIVGYVSTIIDITEHKRFEENLQKYKILADNANDIVLFIGLDGSIIEANAAAVKAYGYSYEELCSMNIRKIRDDWGYTKEQIEKADRDGILFEATHRRKDGNYMMVEISSKGATIDGKRIIFSIVRDISDRKFSEEKIKEKEELFRTVFEQSPTAIGLCDSAGEIYDVNPMYEKLFGRTKEELRSIGWIDLTYPDDIKKDLGNFEKYKGGNLKTYNTIKRYIRPDGSIVWGNLKLAPLILRNNVKMNLCMIEDMTERVELDQALKANNYKQKAMIQNISDIIAIIDENMTIIYISSNITKWFGWTIKEVMNESFYSFINPENIIQIEKEFSILIKKEFEVTAIEFSFRCSNGKLKIVEATAKNLLKNKYISGILINFRDITARKKKEEEVLFLYQHDTLTGLYNRRFFDIKVKQMVGIEKTPLSIIIGDINGLKTINEAYGNLQGDRLITKTAELIKKCLGNDYILARMGGGDFKMLLPNTDHEEANEIMKRIELSFNSVANSSLYKTSFSLGCATKTSLDEPIEKIMQLAEEHMRKDKLLHKESMQNSLIMSLKSTLFEKSQETEEHAERLVKLSKAIGNVLNLTDDKMNELELLSVLHDIGKIGVKDSILEKKERLTEEEWNQIMQHSIIGYRIAKSIPILQPISEYILYHHERYDGNGYPHKKKGEEIPLLSRIISIVDSYDAMTSDRVYRKAMTKTAAIEEIRRNLGSQFDPIMAEKFIDLVIYSEL